MPESNRKKKRRDILKKGKQSEKNEIETLTAALEIQAQQQVKKIIKCELLLFSFYILIILY